MQEELLTILENSRNYTLAVAAAMPADKFNFKPAAEVWNFGDLLQHIGYGIHWWEDNYVKGKKTEWDPPAALNSKQKVVEYLDKAYDSLKEAISKKSLSADSIKGFHATIDHITHHRGQAVLHLRQQGITPPEYVY